MSQASVGPDQADFVHAYSCSVTSTKHPFGVHTSRHLVTAQGLLRILLMVLQLW